MIGRSGFPSRALRRAPRPTLQPRALSMLARSLVFLAIVGCTAGQTAMPKGKGRGADGAGKGAGKGAGRGAPTPANLPELHILRDEMRRAWCAGGRNAATTPCQMEAFMAKVKAESDPVKKKALTTAHVTEQAEKRNSNVKCSLGGTPARPLRLLRARFWRLPAARDAQGGSEAEPLGAQPAARVSVIPRFHRL